MALNHNIIPQTSLVFGVRDFTPQIDALQKGDTQGLQNAFKFGTQVYDAQERSDCRRNAKGRPGLQED